MSSFGPHIPPPTDVEVRVRELLAQLKAKQVAESIPVTACPVPTGRAPHAVSDMPQVSGADPGCAAVPTCCAV